MSGIYGSWAHHQAFSAQQAGLDILHGLLLLTVLQIEYCTSEACLYKFSGGAAGGTGAASHAFEHIRLKLYKPVPFFKIPVVEINSGTFCQ